MNQRLYPELKVVTLDNDVDPRVEVWTFKDRTVVFEYKGHWYYRIGSLERPKSSARYTTYHDLGKEQVWCISKDVLKLIEWKQEQKQEKEESNGLRNGAVRRGDVGHPRGR